MFNYRLTAFVVKSFAQAKQYIFIDDKLVLKALDWLVLQQDETIGTFKEPGKVLHKAMQVCVISLKIQSLRV